MIVKKRKGKGKIRKKNLVIRKKVIIHSIGYRKGRIDGLNLGKEVGFQQGFKDALNSWTQVVHQELTDALVITPGYIASLEIGIIQPFNEMKQGGNFTFDVKLEGEVTREAIASANYIVFLRNVEPAAYEYLEWAHEMGKRTIYVIDDNFLEIPQTTPLGLYYADPIRRETFIKFLKNAQTIKVDAEYFGNYIRTHYNPNVVYFPASVNFSWLGEAEQPNRDKSKIVIGYAGGYKQEAFAPVVQALLKILAYYGGFVRLEFFGFAPSGLINHPNVSYSPSEPDYKKFIQQLYTRGWDIGLAPLDDTLFNNFKTNNKFRDYSACWIPSIYSGLPLYTDWIKHGETGYLLPTHTVDSWYAGIKQMIEDPDMRNRIKNNAGHLSRTNFTIEACAEKWRNHIFVA